MAGLSPIWRPHPTYQGIIVSTHGVILDVRVPMILKQLPGNKQGHLRVYVRGYKKSRYVHHLVLETFDRFAEPGEECRHGNDISNDNRRTNLSWGTRSDNVRDSVANGRHYEANKTQCDQGHDFTPENTKIHKLGWRYCWTCAQASNRRHKLEQKLKRGVTA